ncbi:MAG: peptidoglycan-binding domain-containing protein [Rhodobacteraceae bacterium]|nr:peptidoglycan-binding domain-containing protein [Paracoccaceae bacterium]
MPTPPSPKELAFTGPVDQGARGKAVRFVQEWLTLNGSAVAIDGNFGPATRAAVVSFQQRNNIQTRGTVDARTHDVLTAPMRRALAIPRNLSEDFGAATVALARQHLAEHPREVGGPNCGPWVRLYMDGNQGVDWPWCAGFVSLILRQAAAAQGRGLPFPRTYSCDILATNGQCRGLFVNGRDIADGDRQNALQPGMVFLCRRMPDDWVHTGFITETNTNSFGTIEGNTNDSGSREGIEVLERTRGYAKMDFVRLKRLDPLPGSRLTSRHE